MKILPIKFSIYERMAIAGFRTQKDLAEKVGIAPWRMSVYIKGNLKRLEVETLARLCEVLECQPGDLMQYEAPAADDPADGDVAAAA